MKIKTIATTNFASYPEFNMSFDDLDLALIYGPTGAGKSTVMDMVSWCLYGVTAKGLAVDEVRSWHSKDITSGTVTVETGEKVITIIRERGNKVHDNDLYMLIDDKEVRGKDATETQQLISTALGVTAEEFITASYFHEFSDAANFFVAKAKDRRGLFEKLAPLEFPKDLGEKSAVAKKATKTKLAQKEVEYASEKGKWDQLVENRDALIEASKDWFRGHAKTLVELENLEKNYAQEKENKKNSLQVKFATFEKTRDSYIAKLSKRLSDIEESIAKYKPLPVKETKENKCKSCGQLIVKDQDNIWKAKMEEKEHASHLREKEVVEESLKKARNEVNTYQDQINELENSSNPYTDQLAREKKRENPFVKQAETAMVRLEDLNVKVEELAKAVKALEARISDLGQLYDLASMLRGELLKRTVGAINERINNILETYFDSELRVTLILDEDDLEVNIQKSGYDCNYRQLSKGQRQLLRLSFVVAVQESLANKLTVSFQNLFFDEALDGLDEDLKVKAFALFEALSLKHESILIIDHSKAFHNMFSKKFKVTMTADRSSIEEEEYEQP